MPPPPYVHKTGGQFVGWTIRGWTIRKVVHPTVQKRGVVKPWVEKTTMNHSFYMVKDDIQISHFCQQVQGGVASIE